MIIVNAVDSFCNMKLKNTKGNGEKKLYLSKESSLEFFQTYLGIRISNGSNIYKYNDELRTRTRGYMGLIEKSNLQYVFNRSINEYSNIDKYRNDLNLLRYENQKYLDNMNNQETFQIDCSLSEGRIYIGSKDPDWLAIPRFCIPRESQVRITNLNDSGTLRFEILY